MKYYISNKRSEPQCWNGKIIYFTCWLDAIAFLEGMDNIEFLDTEDLYTVPLQSLCLPPEKTINLTGFIPVANGDSIELKEYAE